MFEKKEREKPRFVLRENHAVGMYGLSIICDVSTGVHYLAAAGVGSTFSAITPLLDETGKVVIEKNVE